MKKFNYKRILKTLLLLIILLLIIYIIIANFVVGPSNKNRIDNQSIVDKISNKNKTCNSIERTSFKYVTYTCTSEKYYVIYNEKGNKILSRKKNEADFDKVKNMINNKYSYFADSDIQIGYGKKNIAYFIEKNNKFLVIDFDSYKVVFNSGGN